MPDRGDTGERGPTGDHGQHGDVGARGPQGERGLRGRSLTVWQGVALFILMAAVLFGVSYRTEIQQRQIAANSRRIIDANYRGCLGGVAILDRYNKQMGELARIEKLYQNKDPRLRDARVKAYLSGQVVPLPQCVAPR